MAKGLAEKIDLPKSTIKFAAKHPENLELLLAKQKAAVFLAEEELNKQLPSLRSVFQLSASKPGVKFYEGLEGAKKVVEDSLSSSTEILSYIDSETLNKQFPKLSQQFTSLRTKKGIQKKIIMADSPFVRQHVQNLISTFTQIRLVPIQTNFSTIMYIYDNKISYISMEKNIIASMIIEHPAIYKMNKALFKALWETAKTV
jgi:hypothetical protein